MGFNESAEVHIGLKIQLINLINQIDSKNYIEIKNILSQSYIDYQTWDFNEMLRDILYECIYGKDHNLDYDKFKNEFCEKLKNRGTIARLYDGTEKEIFDYGYLHEKYLLFPIHKIIETNRHGFNREGTNGTFCNLDFDIEVIKQNILQKYDWIKDIEIVMMIQQSSG